MRVQKTTNRDGAWIGVGDNAIFVNDVIDAECQPEAKMTVGFARLDKGAAMEISFRTTRC